ncbi:hypothetical protein Ciccas_009217 [Cichlidogyrus casuarinus]|uniref:Bestrophin homolog n=1 Tax=Cichlidogyrus casuarinus TaxID=1844966 RepID=A0ABD2PXP4_9PLAT
MPLVRKFSKFPGYVELNEKYLNPALLFRWQHSIWQYILVDLFLFLVFYYFVALIYYFLIVKNAFFLEHFIYFVNYLQEMGTSLPLFLCLGFFVTTVIGRWWAFTTNFPSLTSAAITIQASIRTKSVNPDQKLALMKYDLKNAYGRYILIAWIFMVRKYSEQIKHRFSAKDGHTDNCKPCCYRKKRRTADMAKRICLAINDDSMVQQTYGILFTEEEIGMVSEIELREGTDRALSSMVPLRWAYRLTKKTIGNDLVKDAANLKAMLNQVRTSLEAMEKSIIFSIPVVYIQALTIVTYAFFATKAFGRQFITKDISGTGAKVQIFFPWIIVVQYVLFMCWFKIGASLIRPMTESISSFPTCALLDYNLDFLNKFTLMRSSLLPETLQKSGHELKNSLHKDSMEIFCKMRPESFSIRKFLNYSKHPNKDRYHNPSAELLISYFYTSMGEKSSV